MRTQFKKNAFTVAAIILSGICAKSAHSMDTLFYVNSGNYTVPKSHVGFTTIVTSSSGNVGTLSIPSGSSLTEYGNFAPYSLLSGGSINTINNQGSLTGFLAGGLRLEGSVNELINTGTISSTYWYGISNTGTIKTLTNAQGDLTYRGVLPSNYNVVISSATNYGKTTFTSASGGPMNFGISSMSTLPTGVTTYNGVLSGLSSSNLTSTSGTFGGGIVSTPWKLVNVSGTDWNLTTTVGKPTSPTIAASSAATSQAAAITTAYTAAVAATAASATAPTPVLSNGTPLAAAVQELTTPQVNQLTNVHAEGYSSNMTIGLEQMAHITNTVMDRIHAPMNSSPSTKVYQDDEGRYVWADAAAVKGTVNNYNGLAGFGYNLYDIILGGDIKRTKNGGFGVFAGAGTTAMTESQQVTQNFNTTNYYAGLYGAYNFAERVKLSGALGYMYGNTDANRNTPNVGQFTGGNATSSYKTNGVYGAAKLAKAYAVSDLTVSPFVGASYSQLWMGGATEQGGNDFNFAIRSATAYTAVTFAGADFIYPLLKGVSDPLSLIGFYKFGYDWFANSNSAHSITAVSPTYGSFTQVGANMGPISNMVGLGLQGGITKEVSARIGAVASYNTYGQEYGGGAELRFKF